MGTFRGRAVDPDAALLGMLGMTPNASAVNARIAVSREYAFDTGWFYGLDPGAADWDARASVEAQLAAAAARAFVGGARELGLDPTFAPALDAPWVIDERRPLLTPRGVPAASRRVQADAALDIHSLFDFRPPRCSQCSRAMRCCASTPRRQRASSESPAPTATTACSSDPDRDAAGPRLAEHGRQALDGDDRRPVYRRPGGDAWRRSGGGERGYHVDPSARAFLRETGPLGGRLDAWITALATKRLQDGRGRRCGIHLGVTAGRRLRLTRARGRSGCRGRAAKSRAWHSANAGARPRAVARARRDRGDPASATSHAAAGHGDAVAVDLTSSAFGKSCVVPRRRPAGAAGALLGYRFERALHERHQGLDLDKCMRRCGRSSDPGGKLTDREGTWPRRSPPRTSWTGCGCSAGGSRGRRESRSATAASSGTSAEGAAIIEELNRLATLVDGLGDTILPSRCTHRWVAGGRGRVARRALPRRHSPGGADAAHAALRTGQAHRVAVLLRGSVTGGGWSTGPRAKLEPALEAWTATPPDPADACTVKLFDAAGRAPTRGCVSATWASRRSTSCTPPCPARRRRPPRPSSAPFWRRWPGPGAVRAGV